MIFRLICLQWFHSKLTLIKSFVNGLGLKWNISVLPEMEKS